MVSPASSPGRRRKTLALAAVVLSSLLALLASECVLRALGRRPHAEIVAPALDALVWIRDPKLGYRNRPGVQVRNETAGSTVTIGTFGERKGIRWTDDARRPIVLFVGDSTIFCGELDDEATGPSRVAQLLPETIEAGVINAGVRGYSTIQVSRMAHEWLERRRVLLVVYTYCDNDYVENLHPLVNTPARAPVARVSASGGLAFKELPEDAGPWGASVADTPPPEATIGHGLLAGIERHSVLATLVADLFDPTARRLADHWTEAHRWADSLQGDQVLALLLASLREDCEKHEARLLVTRFATGAANEREGAALNTQEKLVRACGKAGVRFVDVSHAFTGDPSSYRAHLLNGRIDPHYGALGAKTYAGALAPEVIAALTSSSR